MQSFDTRSRHYLERMDGGDVVAAKIEELKSYNSASVLIDLMYGLPYQSEADFVSDIILADKLNVDGISFNRLNIRDEQKKNGEADFHPEPASLAEQAIYFIKAHRVMHNFGYNQLSIHHGVKSSRDGNLYDKLLKEGNILYCFATGAVGRMGKYSSCNHSDMEMYLKMVDEGLKPAIQIKRLPHHISLFDAISGQMSSVFLRFDYLNKLTGTDMRSLFTESCFC